MKEIEKEILKREFKDTLFWMKQDGLSEEQSLSLIRLYIKHYKEYSREAQNYLKLNLNYYNKDV